MDAVQKSWSECRSVAIIVGTRQDFSQPCVFMMYCNTNKVGQSLYMRHVYLLVISKGLCSNRFSSLGVSERMSIGFENARSSTCVCLFAAPGPGSVAPEAGNGGA
jgi:hypothetical protein